MAVQGPLLIAYDGSEPAKAAVDRAGELWPGAAATVLTVWQAASALAPPGLGLLPQDVVGDAMAELERAAEHGARGLAEDGAARARERGLDAAVATRSADESVWRAVARAADELDARAVVVGSRGHGELHDLLLGSVSNGLVHHSGRPVLVVRS